MADMREYDKAVPLLEHNPQLLTKYLQVLDRTLDEFLRVDGSSKWDRQRRSFTMASKAGLLWVGCAGGARSGGASPGDGVCDHGRGRRHAARAGRGGKARRREREGLRDGRPGMGAAA